MSRLLHSFRIPAILAALCALALPATAGAAKKGLSVDMTWGTTAADQDRTAQVLPASGSQWVRLTMEWRKLEPRRKGSYDSSTLASYDRAVSLSRQAGQKVLIDLYSTPAWASPTGDTMAPPANNADYADVLRFLAARYSGQVAGWEIWNEPNTARFWSTGPDAAQYAGLLKAAYPAAKQGDPDAKVVFAGPCENDYAFIEGAYAAGAKGYFDVMGSHPYSGAQAPDVITQGPDGRSPRLSFSGYRDFHQIMLANGDDKPIWITEFGWSTSTDNAWGVSLVQQADYITRAYKMLEHDPYVEMAIYYNFRNNFWNHDADGWEYQLGLLRTDFTPKPSYYAFQAYAPAASIPDPPPIPDPAPAPAPVAEPTAPADGPPATGTTSQPAPAPTQPARGRTKRTATTLSVQVPTTDRTRAAATRVARRKAVVSGRVKGATGGRVVLTVRRAAADGRLSVSSRVTVRIRHDGTFTKSLTLTSGRWLVRARFAGAAGLGTSRSNAVSFRL